MTPPDHRPLLAATTAALTADGTLPPADAATATSSDHANRRHHSDVGATSAPLARGLHQSAHSERHDTLRITASPGQPPAPATNSHPVKADPGTPKTETAHPAGTTASGGIEPAYGTDVHDEHDTVRNTGTRDNSISLYSQRTGKHLTPSPPHTALTRSRRGQHTRHHADQHLHPPPPTDSRTFQKKKHATIEGAGPRGPP
ncbi:hypothetical protein ACWGJ2_39295 [Streptomyces sp. NPDC054796]